MPSFFCIKFGLGIAGCVLATLLVLLAGYWKLCEYRLNLKSLQ